MMKTLHHLLLGLVTAQLLSEVYCTYCPPKSSDPLCGISGYECRKSSECCENHCCVRGVCEGDYQTRCNPCDEIVCQSNETCQAIKDPNCASEPCEEEPRCFPLIACNIMCQVGYQCVIDYSTDPPTRKCVPKENPCENILCPEFQQCYLESPNCLVDQNQPVVVCAYPNPCDFIICANGTICSRIEEKNAPPKAQCVQEFDQCYDVQCPEYQKCYLVAVQCIQAPCPPQPECAYYNPCMFTKCSPYYVCKLHQEGNNPPAASCVLDYESFCTDAVCPQLQKCYLKPDDWRTSTTPFRPETVCDYYDPCILARCPGGYKCAAADNGYYPPTASCVPSRESICEGTLCPIDQSCYLKPCDTEPCLPQTQCTYENPCIFTKCANGNTCIVEEHGDYPPTPKCVYDPKTLCMSHECPSYQKCYLMDVYCITSPCLPEPVCSYPNPCLFVFCGEGYTCVVTEDTPRPPTAYCLQNYDICFGVSCNPGYSCYIKDVECTDFECFSVPPSAVCSLLDPCVGVLCPANSHCVTTQRPRKNPPEAKCVLTESPCENIVCESYENCYVKDYDSNETACFDVTPVGVCALPDPCVAAQCLQNTTCQVVQIRRNPPQSVCSPSQVYNPCDELHCDLGLKCFIRDVDCNAFSCVGIPPEPVCSQPDPCVSTLCAKDTVCVPVYTRNNPPVAECRPTHCLCDTLKCDPGQQCYVRDYECGILGCSRVSKPYPICAMTNPCEITLCSADSICNVVQVRDNPPLPICVSIPSAYICVIVCDKSGYSCYIKDMKCDDFLCMPIVPEAVCALNNPCSVVHCAGNTTCVESFERNNPPKAVCEPINPCASVACSEGEECYIKEFECNVNGCAYIEPKAVCAYTDPCSTTLCDYSTCFVQQIRNNPPFAICGQDSNPCNTVECPPGDLCYVKDYECDKCSCRLIKPQALCAPAYPCYEISCPANSVCIPFQIRTNPQQGYCISNKELCSKVQCAEGEKCYVVPVYCIRAPCSPQPICHPADPCAFSTCLPGYKCVNRQYNENPPFPECIQLEDPCDGINCSDGQQCNLREKHCVCPPCGYEGVCAYPNPCILALCPEGHNCYTHRVGRMEPIPVCYPVDNPCIVSECLPGQVCTSMQLTTIPCYVDLPCPVMVCVGDPTDYLCSLARCGPGFGCVVDLDVKPLVAKCVPYNNPCDYFICPVGSSCVVLTKYPPVGQCLNITATNPCSVVQCKSGYQCEETDTYPVQAVCVGTCHICPPSTECVVTNTFPPMIACLPNPKWLITYTTL